jgi:hypothetical protein
MRTLTVDTRYPPDWDGDVPLLASRPWLEVMAGRIEGEPLWLTTRAGPCAEVGFAAYLVRDVHAYAFGNLATLVASPSSPFAPPPVRQALTAAMLPPAALIPHLLLTWPGYASFPVGPGRDDAPAVREALSLILGWAAGQGVAAVAIPYAPAGVLADTAQATGFQSVPLTHEATLPIPEGGFASYLERLPSRRRRRIAAERRAWHERGQRAWRVEPVTAPVLERLAQLRAAQRRRYGIAGEPAQERTRIAAVLDRLPVDVFVVGESPAEILGFALFVRDGATWHALYFGADDRDPRSRGGYFEAVFYTPIELGRQLGLTQISFGLGASEAKQLRGCLMTPVDCLVTATAEPARAAVSAIVRMWAIARPGIRGEGP